MPDFKFLLPPIGDLYPDQRLAYNPRQSILVTGGPGSGKTVISIFRFIRSINENKDILLFTFNRTLIYSIRGMLKDRAETLFGNLDEVKVETIIENYLATFFQWHYDNIGWFNAQESELIVGNNFTNFISNNRKTIKYSELFFDEGQDLPPAVYANAFKLATIVSVGADKAQNFQGYYLPDTVEQIINEKLNTQSPTLWQYLGGNFRNTKEICELAKKFVPQDLEIQQKDCSRLRSGNNPEIEIGLILSEQLKYLLRIIENNTGSNIGILVHKKEQVVVIKNFLESQGYSCKKDAPPTKSFSYYYNKMNNEDEAVMMKKLRTPFVATFDSCKGLEFNIVVLPFFESADETSRVTRNHYYVAVTRAINDIYILCNSKPRVLSFFTVPQDNVADDLPF